MLYVLRNANPAKEGADANKNFKRAQGNYISVDEHQGANELEDIGDHDDDGPIAK